MKQEALFLFPTPTANPAPVSVSPSGYRRAIEETDFPFEHLSDIAEIESWRKEISRPIYHVHKWWAQRLGSVFRAIVLGTFAPAEAEVLDLFYRAVRFPELVVLDPFMGSGTTIGEAVKLGARAIGFDINPVAHFLVRNALGLPKRADLLDCFHAIERDVAHEIQQYYRTQLLDGQEATVLYYFWVKQLPCPRCQHAIDLFSSYVFADHAYRDRNPEARALCPECGDVNVTHYDAHSIRCRSCRSSFDPQCGPARGQQATCPRCSEVFQIVKVARAQGAPPKHRLYAKLVLKANGDKEYLRVTAYDVSLYKRAEQKLAEREHAYPVVKISAGHNTNQVLNYSYTCWHEMFNARQLLCLSLLANRIRQIPDERLREAFCCLFSGALEFNNMFASYKGEGTGAVRHMFYHHILKPERAPLEANVWGTPRSSGAFSTLFRTRLLRALDYCEDPFELWVTRRKGRPVGTKIYSLSASLSTTIAGSFGEFETGKQIYLGCRDSSSTDLPPASVDAIITDPPFFDNVHYSELADFFYVWQRYILGPDGARAAESTRLSAEVQQSDTRVFTDRLTAVWRESWRVLKPHGLLVFTYHHSRAEGWLSVLLSLVQAGFVVVQTHPIKSEMSVATPKHQAKEPIDLDMIVVCRRREDVVDGACLKSVAGAGADATQAALAQLKRLRDTGRVVSRNDVRVVLMAQTIARLSRMSTVATALAAFEVVEPYVEERVDHVRRELGGER